MTALVQRWLEVMQKGDWMMYILISLAALLWFCLGWRTWVLRNNPFPEALQLLAPYGPRPRPFEVQAALGPMRERLGNLRALVNALVALAPMAGLLGTVGGMMVMFDSIGDSTFASQTGGITNGIAQALYTTETALVIAVPGLVWARILNRLEDRHLASLEQLAFRPIPSHEVHP